MGIVGGPKYATNDLQSENFPLSAVTCGGFGIDWGTIYLKLRGNHMVNVTALADVALDDTQFDYSFTQTMLPSLFEYREDGNVFDIRFLSAASNISYTGSLPDGGIISSMVLENQNTATDLLSVTGLAIDASVFSSAFTGDFAYQTVFGGDDTFDGVTFAVTFIGDRENVGTGAAYTAGNGNDTYVVDNAGDVITELAAEGFDTINTTINYDMSAEVEVLNMLGTADLQTNGNSLANHINGNSGNNYINGAAGTDLMTGGSGNDTYAVDNSYDQVVEIAGGGSDAVYSSVDLLLAGNVETLVLTESAIQGFGDATNNQIFGNGNVNVLFGQGGDDYLLGLGGDDIFVITPEAGAFDVIGDFQGAGVAGGDRIGISGFGPGAAVYQVSQTSFEIRSADNSVIQQFVLQGHDGTALDAGDYYFA